MFMNSLHVEHVETCAGALGQLGTIRALWHPSRPLNRPGLGCASIEPGIFAPSQDDPHPRVEENPCFLLHYCNPKSELN